MAYSTVYPIDLVKTMFSINYISNSNSIYTSIYKIARENGVRALYKGLGTTCFGIFPYAGFKFAFFEEFRRLRKKYYGNQPFSSVENLVFGGLAGCGAVTITYPTDLLRRKRQVQIILQETKDLSFFGLIRNTYQKEGIRAFYKGLAVTYYKVIPSTALAFAMNEFLKKTLVR